MLDGAGACSEQVELFAAMWGRRVVVSRETCAEAAALGLDVKWAVQNMLPKPLRDAYNAQLKPLNDAYWAQRKPLYDAYYAQCKPLDDAYDAQCKPLRDAYNAQYKTLDDAYNAQRWALFANIVEGGAA
jgi:hypothetical protein